MIDLPAALAAWAPQLAVLPGDVALTLAPWVGRLALAVGPLATARRLHGGDPDGYGGLSRRGSYERLIATEWGIAEAFPDEFIRRAAAGEHVFLELARREPRGALRSIAIVSAGPAQLGAPRLAHVATLIVLARRAAAAGASFAWGVLEDRQHRLHDRLDEAAIEQLLAARTALAADADAIAAWLHALGGDPTRDFWFVGAEDDAANAAHAGASRVIVRDVLEPGARALELDIDRRGAPARLRLELPAPELCARLLRAPFTRPGAAPGAASTSGAAVEVRFASPHRLIVRLADGSYESWPIPTSPRDKLGSPRRWAPPRNRTVLAVGMGHRAVLAATATRDDPTALELHYGSNHAIQVMLPGPVAAELAARFAAREALPVGTCALVRLRDRAPPDLILCVLGRLLVVPSFRLWPPVATVVALPFHGARDPAGPLTLATVAFPVSFAWAEQDDDGEVSVVEATSSGNSTVAIANAPPGPDVRFGFSSPSRAGWGAVVIRWDAVHHIVAAPHVAPTTQRAVDPVVGACMWDDEPGLLTRPGPDALALVIGERTERLPTGAAPIAAVVVCPVQPRVAWLTDTGELTVYSIRQRAVLFRRRPGAEP